MKNIRLIIILLAISCQLHAQTNTFPSTGNVGIGTTNPAYKLEVIGTSRLGGGVDYGNSTILSVAPGTIWFDAPGISGGRFCISGTTGNVGIGTSTPTTGLLVVQGIITSQTANSLTAGNNDAIKLYAGGAGYADGSRQTMVWSQSGLTLGRFGTEYNAGRGQIDLVWRDLLNGQTSGGEAMRLTGGGNLGIGTASPDAKLTVNGTIHSREVKVDVTGWPDYVFNPAYRLKALDDLKSYIEKNHHLPELPSSDQVNQDGQNLGEMNKLLLKKVEELTLYLLEKDQTDKKQQQEIQALRKQFSRMVRLMQIQINKNARIQQDK